MASYVPCFVCPTSHNSPFSSTPSQPLAFFFPSQLCNGISCTCLARLALRPDALRLPPPSPALVDQLSNEVNARKPDKFSAPSCPSPASPPPPLSSFPCFFFPLFGDQLFNEVNARKPDKFNVFVGLHKNPLFIGVIVVSLGMQVCFLYTPCFVRSSGNTLCAYHWGATVQYCTKPLHRVHCGGTCFVQMQSMQPCRFTAPSWIDRQVGVPPPNLGEETLHSASQ